MYPLNQDVPYPREQWYIAGTHADFGRDIVARRILDEPLVFFRTEAGAPVALFGLCPHRLMPFELGSLRGDDLVCGYHGFSFATDGKCVSVPTAEGVSHACKVKSYPLVERGPFVWIWMGDGDADPALLPDTHDIGLGEDSTGWRVDLCQTIPLAARTQLLVDNLLDLSHLAFVHANSVSGGEIALVSPKVETEGSRVIVRRTVPEEQSAGFIGFLMPGVPDVVWNELVTDFYSPAFINAGGPWVWTRTADGARGEPVGKLNFLHGITPETPTSTHYFGALTRNFRLEDDQLSAMIKAQNDAVRAEDKAALEAIEKVVDRHGDTRREISVKPDEGALLVRRRMRELIAQEQTT